MTVPTHMDDPACELILTLFGPMTVQVEGHPLPRLRSRKGLWLLALLTLKHARPVERDLLVGTLWPESSQTQALYNLRQSLSDLRAALGDQAARLQAPTRHTLLLDLAGAQVDVLDFDAGIKEERALPLEQAVEVYRGPLLEGCTEEWALQERTIREQAYLNALERLAGMTMPDNPARAVEYLRRAVQVDALRESAQRSLIQALAAAGDFAGAVLAYRDMRLLF